MITNNHLKFKTLIEYLSLEFKVKGSLDFRNCMGYAITTSPLFPNYPLILENDK